MNTPSISHHTNLAMLGRVLQRLEQQAVRVDADQYRALVERTTAELRAARPDAGLQALLGSLPALAELYENLHYEHAGLCRSPLDAALAAELKARQAIVRARQQAPAA